MRVPHPLAHWRPTRLWLGALMLAIGLAAATSALLAHLRRDAIARESQVLVLLSTALADELDRGLQGAEVAFGALRTELRDKRLLLDTPDARADLRIRADLMPLVRSLWLVDSNWQLIAASDDMPVPPRSSFSGTSLEVGDGPASQAAISAPISDAQSPEGVVVLATPFHSPGTPGGGWILGAVPAELLLGAFRVAAPAPDARAAVFGEAGTRLAGDPSIDRMAVSDSQRLVGRHHLPNHPISLVLTRELDAALSPWHDTARFTGAGALVLILIVFGAVAVIEQTDRRHTRAQAALQAQLARASKLESLGTLAGGVAHDFNNILASILGFGEMAEEAATPGSAQARQLGKVVQAALRGKALVERILAFSRGGAHASVVFELAPVVEEVLGMLAGSLRAGIVIERALDAPGAKVRGDPTQAFEAVMNLCTNALQAMPGAGTLRVGLRRENTLAPRVLSHSQLPRGRYLALSVSDQGTGITPEVMEHLFEPFFTTRRAAHGTGLGLAVVHGVVTEFGGAIDVASTVGRGTTFTLFLPETDEPARSAMPRAADLPSGRGQRILVIDDEPALVELADEMLAGLGYNPTGFTDPAAALRAFQDNPAAWDAILTDEVMPGMTGTELAQAIRRLSPDLPVLVLSGFGGVALALRASAAGATRVLSKPLQRADLAHALQAAIAPG